MAKLMTAKYAGKCRTCGNTFPVGASIAHVARGDARHALCTSEGRAAATADRHVCNVTCNHPLCDGSEADHARLGCVCPVCPDLSGQAVDEAAELAEVIDSYGYGTGYSGGKVRRASRGWAGQAGKWREGVFFRGCGCEDYPCCGH